MTATDPSPSRAPDSLDASSEAGARPQGFFRRHAAKLIASAIITAGIIYTVRRGGLKFVPEGGDFNAVKWWVLPVYVLLFVVMHYFRSVRWRFLLRGVAADLPKRRILAVSWIGFAAILMMPFRIGEVVRPYMIRDKGKVSLTAATSSIIAERIIDGLYLSVVLAIALIFVPTQTPVPDYVVGLKGTPVTVEHVRMSGFVMLGVFVTAFLTIAVFYFARGFAHRFTMATVGRVSKKLGEKLAGTFEKFANGLSVFGSGKDALGFFFETTLYWGANVFGMWLLAYGCGIVHADGSPITFGETCAMMGMLGVTVLVPGPPGLLGLFQVGVFAGMTMYFPRQVVEGQGAAYVFLLYAIQVICTLIAAGIFLVGDRRNLRDFEASQGIRVGDSAAAPNS